MNFLLTHSIARESDGTVLLRIDDLDAERARPAYVQDIFDSLRWLGITWEEGPRDAEDFRLHWSQAGRSGRAEALLLELQDMGALYACSCTRRTVAGCTCFSRSLPFDAPDIAWRARLPRPGPVNIRALFGGGITVDVGALMPDPVLRQRNGRPAYQLASLADDVHFRIDTIVRGEDLLPSTACQLHLARLLGLDSFLQARFLHHPLLTDERGLKLSKSEGVSSLRSMREKGLSPDKLHRDAASMFARARTGP